MIALFFPLFPPRSASFKPQRLRSQSPPNGPRMCCAPCTSNVRRYGSPSLLMCICSSLCPEVPPSRLQSQITAHVAALAEAVRIFQGQQEGQRDQRAYTLDLFQQRHLRVTLLCKLFDPLVIFAYL